MRSLLQRPFRIAARVLWLAGEVVLAIVRFSALIARQGGIPDRAARTLWLQRVCRRSLRVFQLDVRLAGPIPSRGLLVCNHVSYLDILVLGAITPCVFVSKCEVKRWPVFGWFASLAGTLFLRRDKRSDVARMAPEMCRLLDDGLLVTLFPEGTTSDGRDVLPFKSSLLEPATRHPCRISAGFIEYALSDGDVAQEVCYWKDMTLLPHLLNLFGKSGVAARLCFAEFREARLDRKQLARQLRSQVLGLRQTSVRVDPSM
jgi:1-acyl-sn-glycerol-3-phosphate acyltransferase